MEVKKYKYPATIQFAKSICFFGTFLIWSVVVLSIGNFFNPIIPIHSSACDNKLTECLLTQVGLFLTGLIPLLAANYYPDIEVSDQGLHITFMWIKLLVPWNNIMGMKQRNFLHERGWFIKTNSLTVIHYIYGLMIFTFSRGFFINSRIIGYKQLLKTIQNRKYPSNQKLGKFH